MNYILDDLVKLAIRGEVDTLVHGCNCFCTMGAGIAKTIRETWPEVYETDCKTVKGDRNKLGTCGYTEIEDGFSPLTVINAYTQYGFGTENGPPFDYDAFRSCLYEIKKTQTGKHIGFPLIGTGLAGGNWVTIYLILQEVLGDEKVTIVEFSKE